MKRKILAVASNGGHWSELQRVLGAFKQETMIVVIASVPKSKIPNTPYKFYNVKDATRWNKFRLIQLILQMAWILLREKPDFIISTGAACGYVSLILGKLLIRAKTIWIDSIANVESISMSGQLAGRYADLWLTQWSHLARANGPKYEGSVL